MKNVLMMVLFSIIAASCSTAKNAYIGMSETEFRKKVRAEMVQATSTTTIYKRVNQPFGGQPSVKYYYFKNGKLVQIDEGERNPDIIIENRRN